MSEQNRTELIYSQECRGTVGASTGKFYKMWLANSVTVIKLLIMCFQVLTHENKAIQYVGTKSIDMYSVRISRSTCKSFISAEENSFVRSIKSGDRGWQGSSRPNAVWILAFKCSKPRTHSCRSSKLCLKLMSTYSHVIVILQSSLAVIHLSVSIGLVTVAACKCTVSMQPHHH